MTRNQKHTYAALFTNIGVPSLIVLWSKLIGFGIGSAWVGALVLSLSLILGTGWVVTLIAMNQFQLLDEDTTNPIVVALRKAWAWFNSDD